MARAGRPTKYRTEFAKQAAKLCALGATDAQLADFFGVSIATVSTWKNVHPEFLEALKATKAVADEVVERSLYQRAVGYEADEVDIRVVKGKVIRTPIRRRYPPETVAAIFWLKNRQPGRWRDIKAVELSNAGEDTFRVSLSRDDAKL